MTGMWQDEERGSTRPSTSLQAIPAEALASMADSGGELKVIFDNSSDPDCTIINIEGSDQSNLLIRLTGAFR